MDIENTESGRPEAPGTNSEVSGEASKKPDTPGDYFDVLLSGQGPQLYTRVRQPRRVVWSVAWSDLMMTMFILFAVLYIYQAANRDFSFKKQVDADASPDKVTESVAPPQLETTIESAEAFASRMSKQDTDTIRLRNLSDIGKVELKEDKAIRIVLPGDVLFDAGSAELKTSALSTLRLVADAIRLTDYRVNVVGHTDNLPMHSEKICHELGTFCCSGLRCGAVFNRTDEAFPHAVLCERLCISATGGTQ